MYHRVCVNDACMCVHALTYRCARVHAYICVCVVVAVSWHMCGGQKTALWVWFSAPALLRQRLVSALHIS